MKKIGRTIGKLNSKCVSKARMYHSMKLAYHLNLLAKNVEEYVQVRDQISHSRCHNVNPRNYVREIIKQSSIEKLM